MGLTQEQFAKLGGVQRRAQAHYEAGKRTPDANYLAAICERGVDVIYVLTGRRERPPLDSNWLASVFAGIEKWEQENAVHLTADQRALVAEATYRISVERGSLADDFIEIMARFATT